MDQKAKFSEVLKKYTMIIALAVIVILFTVNTGGKMLLPQNVNNLIAQNAYVFILATGMLFCILTGGNIDLSVGSVVCFVGAVGGKMMIESGISREPGTNSWVFSSVSRMSTSLASPLEKRSKASCGDMAGSMGTPLPRLHKAAGLGWGVFPVAQYAVKAYGTREAGARRIRCAGLADNRPVGLEKG